MSHSPPGPLSQGQFSGPAEFAQLVRDALACAAQQGWSEMVWSDAHFEAWPLGERAVAESLHAWSCKGRKLVVLAKNYDYVRRQHARFVAWRSTWDHLLECRTCPAEDEEGFVSALWSPLWAMRRLDLVRCTGYAGYEAQRRVALKEILDEYKRQSSPGFAATTLGL